MAGRPADAAACDAPTVTRRAVVRREVIVVSANSGAPMQVGSGEGVSAPPHLDSNMPEPVVARAQSSAAGAGQHPSGERVVNFGPGDVAPMESTHTKEPTMKSHASVEELDESLVPKRQRGRPATHCWPSPGSPEYTVGCPGCDGRIIVNFL